jgi:uncharacterized protein
MAGTMRNLIEGIRTGSTERSSGHVAPLPFLRRYVLLVLLLTVLIAGLSVVSERAFPQLWAEFFGPGDVPVGWRFVMIGLVAQLIDGALGMAYGLTCTGFLLSIGVPPVLASASVHAAEVFTTAASGVSHWRLGNVDKRLFVKLCVPGAAGAALGAGLLLAFDGAAIKPFVTVYLGLMGLVIIVRAFRARIGIKAHKRAGWLALVGGFVDASGGGGWGPVVTGTLLARGNAPRLTIGTVNAAEFVITLVSSGVFTLFVGIQRPGILLGLVIGGVLAAPLGAFLVDRIPHRYALLLVGGLVVFLAIRSGLPTFGIL